MLAENINEAEFEDIGQQDTRGELVEEEKPFQGDVDGISKNAFAKSTENTQKYAGYTKIEN